MTNNNDTFWKAIDGKRVAMLTTSHGNRLESRPMAPYLDPESGLIRFITALSSSKSRDVGARAPVNIAWLDEGKDEYISLEGVGTLSQDREMLRKLWNPFAEAYLPGGPEGPDAALLTVVPGEAVIWDSRGGRIVDRLRTLAAAVTGTTPPTGDVTHVKL